MEFRIQTVKNIFHFLKAELAVRWYRNPSKHITVVGVTGTDGKTTTASLIYHLLISAGKKASLISTVSAVIAGNEYDTGFHVTTPSPFAVQKYLQQAVQHADEYFVLETTSHALDQYRVHGVDFAYSVLTNISHEHMHYHRTFDHYVAAKLKLLKASRIAIVNKDDQSYAKVQRAISLAQGTKGKPTSIVTYGRDSSADYHKDISKEVGRKLESFNQYNYLAAYALGREIGLTHADIIKALQTFTMPAGRMEVVYTNDFTVIVDFAHTPNALHEALKSIREAYPRSRIIHVFGAAAFRDDEKRPLMGRESATYADFIILTEEDYRTEDPGHIASQIMQGIKEKNTHIVVEIIHNRKEAIQKALSIAQKNDVIVLTGKGHERSLNRKGTEYPWNDKEELLKAIHNKYD